MPRARRHIKRGREKERINTKRMRKEPRNKAKQKPKACVDLSETESVNSITIKIALIQFVCRFGIYTETKEERKKKWNSSYLLLFIHRTFNAILPNGVGCYSLQNSPCEYSRAHSVCIHIEHLFEIAPILLFCISFFFWLNLPLLSIQLPCMRIFALQYTQGKKSFWFLEFMWKN